MKKVLFYTKDVCSLCEEAEALLYMFQKDFPFEIETRDIYSNDDWLEAYQLLIPVVEINGKQINCEEMEFSALEKLLRDNT